MKIVLPKIKKITTDEFQGKFEISPLQPGYGVTLGNTLRRILLSSLAGAAVRTVEIEGVDHEFSTISGIKEDVIEIILAFKKLRVKYKGDEDVELQLNVKGPKKVKAEDIKAPSDIEIVNPDLHIATLQKSGELFANLIIGKGIGYISVEEREDEERNIGQIAIDASYAPIDHVAYNIGKTRVGGTTDYDKLELNIKTDGTVEPESALQQAAKILVKHFDLISQLEEEVADEIEAEVEDKAGPKTEESKKEKSQKSSSKNEVDRETPLEETGLSARTINVLTSNNVRTVGGLARYNKETLEEMEGLGPKSVEEIEKKLKKWNIE
jgi:DNA-directed RNA polymerase subunit alpha